MLFYFIEEELGQDTEPIENICKTIANRRKNMIINASLAIQWWYFDFSKIHIINCQSLS